MKPELRDIIRRHEISEQNHRILNPFSHEKLMLAGEICQLGPDMRLLDLACGKGELLCQWSHRWKIGGIGVDISKVFLTAARQRAVELGVHERITFVEADASQLVPEANGFDIVSCIGATWIGGGLAGTLQQMLGALKTGGLLLVGEPYWIEPPPPAGYAAMGVGEHDFTSLAGTLDRFHTAGLNLVEMVLANSDNWDRYVASQWWTIDQWLRDNPNDPDAPVLRDIRAREQRVYLDFQRRCFGWGVFVLRAR